MRGGGPQKTGYRKNAAVLLLTVAFLFWLWGAYPLAASAGEGDAEEVLLEGLLSCEAVIDLEGYALPASALGEVYARLLYGYPELFHVAPRLSYTYREVTVGEQRLRTVAEVYPGYTMTGEELSLARALYRDTVAAILSEMEVALGGRIRTEAETVLWLHDFLADRYAYDTRTVGNATAYGLFRDGVGICQAYALAFVALARGAGLEAELVTSDAMDHAWNHVRVEGVWYHVDVTRDDPIPAPGGREEVDHTRLLRSDAGMDALGYHGYSCSGGHICADTRFEPAGDGALAGLHSALIPFGAYWLGTVDGAPVAVDVQEDGMTVSRAGDVDLDGEVTPADLLVVYHPLYPDAWRVWLRGALAG